MEYIDKTAIYKGVALYVDGRFEDGGKQFFTVNCEASNLPYCFIDQMRIIGRMEWAGRISIPAIELDFDKESTQETTLKAVNEILSFKGRQVMIDFKTSDRYFVSSVVGDEWPDGFCLNMIKDETGIWHGETLKAELESDSLC